MILLTVCREPAGNKEKRVFARMQEAIEFGQRTGEDYEIFDPVTGKVIDWNEINVCEDDGWYYDEKEYLWKKHNSSDEAEENFTPGDFPRELFSQSRNLRRTGS